MFTAGLLKHAALGQLPAHSWSYVRSNVVLLFTTYCDSGFYLTPVTQTLGVSQLILSSGKIRMQGGVWEASFPLIPVGLHPVTGAPRALYPDNHTYQFTLPPLTFVEVSVLLNLSVMGQALEHCTLRKPDGVLVGSDYKGITNETTSLRRIKEAFICIKRKWGHIIGKKHVHDGKKKIAA